MNASMLHILSKTAARLSVCKNVRFNSTLFSVETESKRGEYAVLKLNKPPMNTFSIEMFEAINNQLDRFENDSSLKGVILTSNVPNVFTSGVDILEMYPGEAEKLRKLWINIQNLWLRLYGSKKIYVAAMNGHALAYGSVIAMSCDYRIMVDDDKAKIGLPAVHLGITPAFWFKETMRNTIGHRACERALELGQVSSPKQALAIGLVDEIVTTENLMPRAEEVMKTWCRIPSHAREATKLMMRGEILNKVLSQRETDIQEFVKSTLDPTLQKTLGTYIAQLKSKRSS